MAGQGKVILDRNGLALTSQVTNQRVSAVTFLRTDGATPYGYLVGNESLGWPNLNLYTTMGSRSTSIELNHLSATTESIKLALTGESTYMQLSNNVFTVLATGQVTFSTASFGIGGDTVISGDTKTGGGLVIGDANLDPLTGVLLMKERTSATSTTPTDTAQIWVQDLSLIHISEPTRPY